MKTNYMQPAKYTIHHGEVYQCDHPYYNRCTLFKIKDKGLAVIQQRFNAKYKLTWWGPIDPWLNDEIFENGRFSKIFSERAAAVGADGLYPTIELRKLMWALRMPPLQKQIWETRF